MKDIVQIINEIKSQIKTLTPEQREYFKDIAYKLLLSASYLSDAKDPDRRNLPN